MYLIPRFIWKKLNPEIRICDEQGFCHECGKQLNGEVCKVGKSNKSYCRKHAKQEQILHNKNLEVNSKYKVEKVGKLPADENELNIKYNKSIKYSEPIKEPTPKFSGHCDFCDLKIGGLDVFKCKYCQQYYCSQHRIPEEHNCPSKQRAILEKKGYVSYKS
jgi:hypothetical protein